MEEEVNYYEFIDFKKRLFKRLDAPRFERDGNVVSMLDAVNALKERLSEYNSIFLDHLSSDVSKMNRVNVVKSLFKRQDLCKIFNIEFSVDEKGNEYITVFKYRKDAEVIDKGKLQRGEVSNEVLNNIDVFNRYMKLLDKFVLDNPGVKYRWNYDYPYMNQFFLQEPIQDEKSYKQGLNYLLTAGQGRIDDYIESLISPNMSEYEKKRLYDHKEEIFTEYYANRYRLISCLINLNYLENTCASLASADDCRIANYDSPTDSELYDYVAFYSNNLLRNTPTNLDELDSSIRTLILNGLDKEKVMGR